jgi:superfamily II DNA or RNA helicase
MTLQLRDYQQQLVDGVRSAWQAHQRVLFQLPTAGGKTVCFSHLAQDAVKDGGRVLVLAHRQELLTQAQAKLQAVTAAPVGLMVAGKRPTDEPIICSSIQSATTPANLQRLIDFEPQLILVDEAHLSVSRSYKKVFEALPNARLAGCTATPRRLDGKGLDEVFQHLVLGPTPKQLIKAGHLVPLRTFAVERPIDTEGLHKRAGEFIQAELEERVSIVRLCGDAVQEWFRLCPGRKTISFCLNVAHAYAIAEAFNEAGVPAAALDGNSSAQERQRVLDAFRDGSILYLANCALFTEGLDVPDIGAIQLLTATASLTKYLQACGRGARPADDKADAIILDHGNNAIRLGLPQSWREWTLDAKPKRPKKAPGEPGPDAPPERRVVEIPGTLRELTEDPADPSDPDFWPWQVKQLNARAEERNYNPGWVAFRLIEQGAPFAIVEEAAAQVGYSSEWVRFRMLKQLDKKASKAAIQAAAKTETQAPPPAPKPDGPRFPSELERRTALKFYVVWAGRQTGIFTSWDEAEEQVKGYAGGRFKSYPSWNAANAAFSAASQSWEPALLQR